MQRFACHPHLPFDDDTDDDVIDMSSGQNDHDADDDVIDINPPVPLSLRTPLHQLRTVAEHHLRLKKVLDNYIVHFCNFK